MPSPTPLLVAVLALLLLATTALADKTLNIHAWPLGAPAPHHLAQLTYDPTTFNATLVSWKAPSTFDDNDSSLIRIGLQKPTWTGILTSTAALGPRYKKTLVLHADRDGGVYGVGLGAEAREEEAEGDDIVDVRVERIQAGPAPVLNKPVVLDESGKVAGQQEPEKTFLQK